MPHTADTCPGAEDYLDFARDRDPAALERALRACADQAYTQARRTLGNAADADDAVQEALLQLVRTAPRYDGTVPFGAWLGRLVRIACLRVLRSDRRRRRREEAVMAQPAPAEDPDRAEQVRALVARLPASDRAAVELHYFAGLPQAEVAAALGSSENAVALRLSRARSRLRSLLGGGASVAVVATLLAAQPAYAAPPQVLAGIAPLTSAVAAGAALPATTVPLSALQKGLLFMSTHPFAAAAILFAMLGAGLLPVALAAGEAHPAPAAPVAAAPPSGPQPWQGKARELLPFLDPAAPVQVAVDWQHLRSLAAATKLTSLLADPRAQPALAHIREQLRLWRAAGGGAPDWGQVFAEADGAVLGLGDLSKYQMAFVAELDVSAAGQVQGMSGDVGRVGEGR
jgi:RNA polymerase sigma factor (sigma-70 family)